MSTSIPESDAAFSVWEVAAITGGAVEGVGDPSLRGVGVSTNSRNVAAGNLFVALRGDLHDGHKYVQNAWSAGAAFAVVSDACGEGPRVVVPDTLEALGAIAREHLAAWRRCTPHAVTVAVTGSAGKTTTKEMLAALLQVRCETWKTPGNLNNRVGLPLAALALRKTHRAIVLEVGMSVTGEIATLARIAQADVAIISSIGLAHAEGVGGRLSDVAREKGDLIRALRATGVAVLCADDPVAMGQRSGAACRTLKTFGRSAGADVRLVARRLLGLQRAVLTIERRAFPGAVLELETPFPGEAQALDLCAAIAGADAALQTPLTPIELALGLQALVPLDGRGRLLRAASGATLVDDSYNANPDSVIRALELTIEMALQQGMRPRAVLGSMKELGVASHQEHRRVIARAVDLGFASVVGCGGEIDEAMMTFPNEGRLVPCGSVEAAIGLLCNSISAEDLLLVKGSRTVGLERVLEALGGAALTTEDN